MIEITDRVGLSEAERARLETFVGRQNSLHDVVVAALALGQSVLDVVVQDEFTHDVVVSWFGERYLVYDTS